MEANAKRTTIDLSVNEIHLLVQSLTHCIDTCKNRAAGNQDCPDCEGARQLRTTLEKKIEEC